MVLSIITTSKKFEIANKDFVIDARILHNQLGISEAFSTWIKTILENIDAKENKDYKTCFPLKESVDSTQKEIKDSKEVLQ